MIFSLDVRRARKGDCLLLHFGSKKEPGLALIDGGPANVYGPHLKPRLVEIRQARKLDAGMPLPLDLMMVSHVDDDHIRGILDLTRELIGSLQAPLCRVLSFWHNTFDDIIGKEPAELTAALTAQFGAASLTGGLPSDAGLDSPEDPEIVLDTLKVLASISQGRQLRDDAVKLAIDRNPEFEGGLILAAKKAVPVAEGLTFVVAGPMKPELQALQKKHDEWLKQQKGKKPEAALAAYVDASVTNLSSIVVLAQSGGKTMLLTGDARGDKILQGLESDGLLKKGKSMHVDVLKVPHHGSSNNLETGFFKRVTASHYVFSGDGEHGNPERETMEMLFAARGDEPLEIHLTYPVAEIDTAREAEWKKQQAKEKGAKTKGKKRPVRADWSAPKQSLAAFFDSHKLTKGQKLSIVDAKKPHVIDLLDPLGF
jgi:hypothetical protein